LIRRHAIEITAVFVLAAAVLFLFKPRPIGPWNYHRIRAGMMVAEVEQIVGVSPGDHYLGPHGIGGMMSQGPFGLVCEQTDDFPDLRSPKEACWWGNHYAITVAFDQTGAAVGWRLSALYPVVNPSIFEHIQMWFGP
jgi:hypothetical protein